MRPYSIREIKYPKIVFFFVPALTILFSFWTFLKCPFFIWGCPKSRNFEKTRFAGRCSDF